MRRLASRALPPLAAFAASHLVLALAALRAGVSPLSPASGIRWDSGHYLSIAARGYGLAPCTAPGPLQGKLLCGNAAWFPLYPALLRAAPIDRVAAGLALSALCHLALLALLWSWLRRRPTPADPLLLLAGALFPGTVYFSAVFPMSLVVLLSCATLGLAAEERFGAASATAFAGAFAYPTGVLAGGAAALAGLGRRLRAGPVLTGACAALGTLAALAAIGWGAKRWDAYFASQAIFEYHANPIDTFFARLKPLVNARFTNPRRVAEALQTVLATAIAGASLARGWPRRTEPLPRAALVHVALAFCIPLSIGGHLSLHRSESLLFPALFLLQGISGRAAAVLSAACAGTAFLLAVQFFNGALV